MLRQRVLSGVVLIIPVLAIIVAGGGWFVGVVLLAFSLAAIEYTHLLACRGHRVFGGLLLLWVFLFFMDRMFPVIGLQTWGMATLLLLTLAWTIARYRQGTPNALTGFAFTLAGAVLLGWTGAHFIGLRALPDGLFWTLTVIGAVWLADTAAYGVGSALGVTPLIPDISPKKTWEGYLGGVVVGAAGGAGLTLLWRLLGAGPTVTPLHGLVIGLLSAIISPLGDFMVSLIKRYAGAKDSSHLIPGHGGLLDRLDSLMIAAILGYYYLTLFVL